MDDEEKGEKLYWAIYENKTQDAVELIKQKSTNVNWPDPEWDGNIPLIFACHKNNLPVVKSLMAREDILPN